MDNLVFFNTSGDSLNFSYDKTADKYSSTLNFDANSSDIFKTIGLYLFESVDSINFDSIDHDTNLLKFQLFNENRFTYNGSIYFTQSVTSISAVNNNGTFFSKWIYGENFESLYPIGTAIKFNNSIFEFSPTVTYVVVGTKKGAIMVVTNTDNVTFNNLYGGITVSNTSISGLNSVGIYDYKRGSIDQLSSWNEPEFYNLLYNDKKLTILNGKTSSVVTVQDCSIVDRNYYKYNINTSTYTQSSDLTVTLTLKTDLPTVYSGGLTLDSTTSRIYFTGPVPILLKPNVNFIINDSILNSNTLIVDNIPAFTGNVVTTYYPLSCQVIWNNLIYQCVQSYTQSLTASTTPDDNNFWTSSVTYLPSLNPLVNETILYTSIHLTTNVFTYNQAYTNSNAVTMASFAQRYSNNFKVFNINLYYDSNTLNSDLIYPSKYAIVDYKIGTHSITNTDDIIERVITTKETLPTYVDNNVCSNKLYSVVLSYIDDFGLKFLINGHVYQEETEYIYNGLNVDQVKTIDRTLRNFLEKNFFRFNSIGIGVSLHTTNYVDFDFYKDTIEFTTEYPNVPFDITIQMGSLAKYYVKHSLISFYDLGSYLNININGVDYGQKITSLTSSTFLPDIDTALSNWVNTNYNILYGYGVYVSSIRNNLYFNIKDPTTRLKYTIKTNKLPTPGILQYIQTNYIQGNLGSLIAGNEVILSPTSSQSFEFSGFSTGMITSINNTIYPYDNQEYNVIYVDNSQLGLSYQGPFWGTNNIACKLSGLSEFGFSSLAYANVLCPPGASGGGHFSLHQFNDAFAIEFVISNTYLSTTVGLANTNMKDMLFVDEYSMIYALGNNLSVVNALTLELVAVIPIVGNTNSIKIVYNSYNKLLYALTNTEIVIVDPNLNVIYATIGISGTDIAVNQSNGDVYLVQSGSVKIFKSNSFTTYDYSLSVTSSKKIVHNFIDNNMYVTGDKVYVINTITRTISTSYIIPSLDNNYIYTEPIYGSVYVWGSVLYNIKMGATSTVGISNTGFNKIIYDDFTGDLFASDVVGTSLNRFNSGNAVEYSVNIGYGDIVINQFDGDLYMVTAAGVIVVISTSDGSLRYSISTGYASNKIIFNPLRNSSIILGNVGSLYELAVEIESVITQSSTSSSPESTSDGFYGTLAKDYVQKDNIWLKTRQYLRRPRFNYSGDVNMQFVWKFEDDQAPEIFMYDITGDYLSTGTSYSYIGPKPLPDPVINYYPNMDINKISDSSLQQTVFDEIVNTLEYYDDPNDISILPTPMQLFLGYNSLNEGYNKTTLKMYARENVSFDINYSISLYNDITFNDMVTYGTVILNTNSITSFVVDSNDNKRGLKPGQLLQLIVSDVTNTNNKYISFNNGKIFEINQVYNNQLVLDYTTDIYGNTMSLVNESNVIQDYPNIGDITYLKITFTVVDKEMVSIDLYGQTEIEDIRFKTELNNTGHNIDPSDAYIFKTYDVEEQGVDWGFLNKKRKEMIMVRSDIFPYVGSYKAIINAINYFGYNDLVLYEYYRNINIDSPNFFKLFKVEIPDIFDNTVIGWTVNDFLKHTMPNPNYEVTNLFNLTYLITDKLGNNVLLYSLQDVITKLHGLKNWLEGNVIPITHRILDITGRTDFVGTNGIRHKSFGLNAFKVNETMTPIDFNINEAYLMPVNSGSTVYNVVLDFVASKEGTLPTNFSLNIRTYKTYKEWNPFTLYNMNDEVIYYDIIYKSVIDSNKILDPRKYNNLPLWTPDTEYFDGQMVNYNRYAYEYLGTQSSFLQFGTASVPTPVQTSKWLNISEWVQEDLKPVQSITEYRYIGSVTYSNVVDNFLFYTASVIPDNLIPSPPFNFSIDSNIDPFIVVEINSENGYGLSYTSRKNYEIRGTSDLYAGQTSIEPIGPFIPITPVI